MNLIKKHWRKTIPVVLAITLLACQDNAPVMSPEQSKAQSSVAARDNVEITAASQDVIEMTTGFFSSEGISNGRVTTAARIDGEHHHDRDHWGCAPNISGSFSVVQKPDTLIYSGTWTIDYGDGSSCSDSSHVRKGKITDVFEYILIHHDSLVFSSTQTLSFDGFTRDSVTLDGTFTTKASTGNPTTVEATDAKLTYPDGTMSTWSGTLSFTYHRAWCDWENNTIEVTGSLSGTNRNGVAYTATITSPIVFKYSCDMWHHRLVPVSGTVEIIVGGVTTSVDFGDGSCDKQYVVSVGGIDTTYEFSRHH